MRANRRYGPLARIQIYEGIRRGAMDVMGVRKEEIIDGVEFAGVATYLGDAENSNVNLFI